MIDSVTGYFPKGKVQTGVKKKLSDKTSRYMYEIKIIIKIVTPDFGHAPF